MKITSVKKSSQKEEKKQESMLSAGSKKNLFQSKASIISLSVVVSILLSGIIYFGFVKNQYDRVGVGKELDTVTLGEQLKNKQSQLDNLKKLQANFEAINDSDIDLVSRILPDEEQIPELLTQLEVIAKQSGVSLIGVNVSEVEEAGKQSASERLKAQLQQSNKAAASTGIKSISVQLDVSAFNYLSFRQFIDSLQSHTRLMDIQRFNFSTENQFHSITLHTYYLET